ncbi:MAG: phosphate ABC transporter substrate-binding/OmpA family protein [Pseudomonadota bacterium]
MKWLYAVGMAAAFLFSTPPSALAQEVRLTARDGALEVSGALVDFDGEFYRIDSVYGILTIDGAGVTCDGAACPDPAAFVSDFMVSGASETGSVLVPALLEAFAQREGYRARRIVEDDSHFTYELTDTATDTLTARVRFRVSSSDEGFADLLADQATIAMSFREVSEAERARAIDAGLGDLADPARSRIVALDGLVPVVSPENPVRAITLGDLADVFAGEIATWSRLGGADAEIALHMLGGGSGLSRTFLTAVMGPARAALAQGITRHQTSQDLADAVAADPLAIGISTFSETGNTRALSLTGSCGYENRASVTALKAEDYPLTVPHFLYAPARRLPRIAREFLAFTQTPEAQIAVRDAGFVDQSPETHPLSQQGDRLAKAILNSGEEIGTGELQRMISAIDGASRLALSFRFAGGASELDAQSRANISLLAGEIERGRFDGQSLLFAGFSDGRGRASDNRRLSLRRAEAVRDAVADFTDTTALRGVDLVADGFGEALPMACDEDAWGQKVNRRVEVWLR